MKHRWALGVRDASLCTRLFTGGGLAAALVLLTSCNLLALHRDLRAGSTAGGVAGKVMHGESDASKVPPGWRGWLAFTVDVPPSEESYTPRPWELPHRPNMTGTPYAYRPAGSMLREDGRRPEATGDYVPWSPDGSAHEEPDDHSPHPGARRNVAHG